MNHTGIDILIGAVLFIIGMVWTVTRYAQHDKVAFSIVAVLAPVLILFAVLRTLYLLLAGKLAMEPCPPGLEEAETLVEQERQKLFGGELRPPMFSANWRRAYDEELQREADRVQRLAEKYFQHA